MFIAVLLVPGLLAQKGMWIAGGQGQNPEAVLQADFCPQVADPKLPNGEIPISFFLAPSDEPYQLALYVKKDTEIIRELFDGLQYGSKEAITYFWDGKDDKGNYVEPGRYRIHILAAEGDQVYKLSYRINLVRFGICAITAQASDGKNEWQMVYFLKGDKYRFYATPATHEYLNIARKNEISRLDLDDGTPRPPPALHTDTATPVLFNSAYDSKCYNYPICYLVGANPRFKVTMGKDCTSREGESVSCGYPLPGVEICGFAQDDAGLWKSEAIDIQPGFSYIYDGPALPGKATRTDRSLTWFWQYREAGTSEWFDVPGALQTHHRFYTIVGPPHWAAGASGTQYSGPWVEAAEYLYTFSEALSIDTSDEAGVVKAFVRGYFGQEGPLATAIEGVIYDTYTMGGDGGASHYYEWGQNRTQLSRLLNNHALGVYVNCSDVASTASVMLGMLGVQKMQMVFLGYMELRAIWGIGCPDYTLNLWGGSYDHAFGYHHIMTRNAGTRVSDACMWVDEDGDPDHLPGTPGYNCDRKWGGAEGYNALSSRNNVEKSLDILPFIK